MNFDKRLIDISMLTDEDLQKSANGIFIGIITLGIPINVIAACIWMFGRKSKTLCCATYFASNAVADFLCLAISGISTFPWKVHTYSYKYFHSLDLWLITWYTTHLLLASSNWISVSITVERALTMFCPFVFRPQAMRRRSKYVVLAICVLLISTYVPLKYSYIYTDHVDGQIMNLFDLTVRIVVPFILIVVINTAVVATLCKKRFQQNTVSTNRRSYVEVFTKITVFTGLSFTLSNTLGVIIYMHSFGIDLEITSFYTVMNVAEYLYFCNCFSNPVICFTVCKSVREDVWSFVSMVAMKCRNALHCRRLEQENLPEPVPV